MTTLAPEQPIGLFVIVEKIADGGMGSVWKARHRLTGQMRALKVILPKHLESDNAQARFIREMKHAVSVIHENVVRTYDPFADGDTLILPMELIEGPSLSQYLRSAETRSRVLPPREAIAIALGVLDGLSAIHDKRIVHRDLTPQNIVLASTGTGTVIPKIVDFGIARALEGDDDLTKGFVLGSPRYMAPEQARVLPIDARVDVFAMGMILREMLTGNVLHPELSPKNSLLKRLAPLASPCDPIAGVSSELNAVVARAIESDRSRRFDSAKEMVSALRRCPEAPAIDRDVREITLSLADRKEFSLPSQPPTGGSTNAPIVRETSGSTRKPASRSSRSHLILGVVTALSLGMLLTAWSITLSRRRSAVAARGPHDAALVHSATVVRPREAPSTPGPGEAAAHVDAGIPVVQRLPATPVVEPSRERGQHRARRRVRRRDSLPSEPSERVPLARGF